MGAWHWLLSIDERSEWWARLSSCLRVVGDGRLIYEWVLAERIGGTGGRRGSV